MVAKEAKPTAKSNQLIALYESIEKLTKESFLICYYKEDKRIGDYINLFNLEKETDLGKIFESEEEGIFTYEKEGIGAIVLSSYEVIALINSMLSSDLFRSMISAQIEGITTTKEIAIFESMVQNGIMTKWLNLPHLNGYRFNTAEE